MILVQGSSGEQAAGKYSNKSLWAAYSWFPNSCKSGEHIVCLRYLAPSVAWEEGVNWGGANEFIVKSGSNGLTLKPTGDAALTGNLDVGVGASTTSIKAYVNHLRHQGNVEIEARWNVACFLGPDLPINRLNLRYYLPRLVNATLGTPYETYRRLPRKFDPGKFILVSVIVTVLYCTVLYSTVLYCTVLYCTVSCCVVSYCICSIRSI